MKNEAAWKPTKYITKNARLIGSRDTKELSLASRTLADKVAGLYQKYIPRYAKGRLPDLGCGKVPLYLQYRPFVDDVFCVDWQSSYHKNIHLDLECDLNQKLPIEGNTFDTIILSDVLEHIAEPAGLIAEISRIMKVKGHLIMNVPFFYRIHESPHDYLRYTEFAVRRFCENVGLNIVELCPLGGVPEILTDITTKSLNYKPLIGKPLTKMIMALHRIFLSTPVGRNFSRKTSATFPFGYFVVARKMPIAT